MKKTSFAEPLRQAVGTDCVYGDACPLDAVGVDEPRIAKDSDINALIREFLL